MIQIQKRQPVSLLVEDAPIPATRPFQTRPMTDAEYLLMLLKEHAPTPVTLNEILQRSLRDRGCGLTVHSRAAELRAKGWDIQNVRIPGAKRGNASAYKLVK